MNRGHYRHRKRAGIGRESLNARPFLWLVLWLPTAARVNGR
jgi:hypothetical protein